MAKNDIQYGGWNSYTLQCGMWLWNRDSEFTKWQHPAMSYVALGWHANEFAQTSAILEFYYYYYYYYYKCHGLECCQSHSCGGTLQKSRFKTVAQLNADVHSADYRSRRRHVSRMTDEKGETWFHFHISPQSTCHSVPVCEILSKSDDPRQKKMTSCRFSGWRISAILDCSDPIMGSLKSIVKLT